MEIGDLVKPTKESNFILRSGASYYLDAVIVSMEPFVLVSWETDMLWNETNKKDFIVKRPAPTEIFKKCLERYKRQS